ncbi:hypothetical protein KUTeg_011074 [Tegillarca granosa]|uniref:Uncharacterized protein n=1 Tax=Tegillarca granosa TaxID=220873 RepID=A0ABQ9F2S8_TEGGR|nr:hypothetical protein KUTeg_011074 [Tegillarca granosa]
MFEGKICEKDLIFYDRMFSQATNSLVLRNEFREYLCDLEVLRSAHQSFTFYGRDSKKSLDTIIKIMHQTADQIDRAIMNLCSSKMVNYFIPSVYKDIQTTTTNKRRYKQIKGLKQFIIKNCLFSDICTGMLLLATLCYLCGEYKEVVIIVQKVLKKIKSYTLYFGYSRNKDSDHQYISAMCGKDFTLYQKLAHDNKLYPQDIETELVQHSSFQVVFIPPVVYCNVLLSLSYYHMECINRINFTLNELYIAAVHNEKFINPKERPLANALLQRCLQIYKKSINVKTSLLGLIRNNACKAVVIKMQGFKIFDSVSKGMILKKSKDRYLDSVKYKIDIKRCVVFRDERIRRRIYPKDKRIQIIVSKINFKIK